MKWMSREDFEDAIFNKPNVCKPKRMNQQEHYLTVVTEEASEVSKEAAKALRFGLEDRWKDQPTVREKLITEFNELVAAMELALGINNIDKILNDRIIHEKKLKIEKFLLYSETKGTLTE